MGNYLTIEAVCMSGSLPALQEHQAGYLLMAMCHMAEKTGEVLFERSAMLSFCQLDQTTYYRAVKVLERVGAIRQLNRGTPGKTGWRRYYQLTGDEILRPKSPSPLGGGG